MATTEEVEEEVATTDKLAAAKVQQPQNFVYSKNLCTYISAFNQQPHAWIHRRWDLGENNLRWNGEGENREALQKGKSLFLPWLPAPLSFVVCPTPWLASSPSYQQSAGSIASFL